MGCHFIACWWWMSAGAARAAGGHVDVDVDVDDATVLAPGRCQVETWLGKASCIHTADINVTGLTQKLHKLNA